jgi:ABC-type branched-subunit amino acid transport system ATPase component
VPRSFQPIWGSGMLEAHDLSVNYGAHRALEEVSLEVRPGEICVVLGANGAGKSSLLRVIAGIVSAGPSKRVIISGKDMSRAEPHEIVEAGVALVPEGRGIFGDLTVAENLELGAFGKRARNGESDRLGLVLSLFPNLGERKHQVARTMSGGEQQMVAIGRALMSNPTILMLDEPSLGLSPLLTRELFKSLRAIADKGVGILLVEQNAKQSLAIADRGYLMENGRITGNGTGRQLANDPAVQVAYLGLPSASGRPFAATEERRRIGRISANGGGRAAQTLAEHAAQIQRAHLAALRAGKGRRSVNGNYYLPVADLGDGIMVSEQARELSLKAGEFAARAARINASHVLALRELHSVERLGTQFRMDDGNPAPKKKKKNARKKQPDVPAKSEHDAGGKSARKKRRLAKKADKLARKAAKLAEKAMRLDA